MVQIDAGTIAGAIQGRVPAQISSGIVQLASEGVIEAGDRLLVVADVTRRLLVSAGTVSSAWRILADLGMVESRGRVGTFILPLAGSWLPPRYRDHQATDSAGWLKLG